MNKTATASPLLLTIWIFFFILPAGLQAQQNASGFLPPLSVYESVYADSVFNTEGELLSESSFEASETVTAGENGTFDTEYDITPFPPQPVRTFRAAGDTLRISLDELLNSGFLDGLGLDIDPELPVDVLRLDMQPGESELITEETISIPLPDSLVNDIDLPPGTSFGDEMDLEFRLYTTRLEDIEIDSPLGAITAAGQRAGFTVDLTVYIEVIIGGPIPITFNLLENYGPAFYFSEGLGLVRELLPPTEVRLTLDNDFFEVDELLTTINGRTVDKTGFEEASVFAETPPEYPSMLQIHPNYPNPFNPTTRLSFTIDRAAHVQLEVFDLQGRVLSQQTLGMRNPGRHEVTFDAGRLSSGIYYYRLTADAGSDAPETHSSQFTVLK